MGEGYWKKRLLRPLATKRFWVMILVVHFSLWIGGLHASDAMVHCEKTNKEWVAAGGVFDGSITEAQVRICKEWGLDDPQDPFYRWGFWNAERVIFSQIFGI